MKISTFNILKKLEEQINNSYSLSIFKGYTAINKQGVEKIIDELYATLPGDVQYARDYLRSRNIKYDTNNTSHLFDDIVRFETILEKGFPIAKYVIVNIKELEQLLDKIYASIPTEIVTAKKIEDVENM